MATRRIKISDEEKLDAANIERVIKLLEPSEEGVKPITKKDACQALNITYNTTRLAKILEDYKAKKAKDAERRAANRGKPATPGEISFVISSYLEGRAVDSICDSIYRPANFVKNILEEYSVPTRQPAASYFKPLLLPDATVRDTFNIGEIVYSARYDSIAKVVSERVDKNTGEMVYCIWLKADKWLQFAYQPASELGSLEHITKLGISL